MNASTTYKHRAFIAVLALLPGLMQAKAPAGPSIVVFSKGPECASCSEQFAAFRKIQPLLGKYGIGLAFTSSGNDKWTAPDGQEVPTITGAERRKLEGSFPEGVAEHATLVLDRSGKVVWKDAGPAPFLDALFVAGVALQTEWQVEIEINNTPETTDDYLTWSPAPARIRLVKSLGGAGSAQVILTNSPQPSSPNAEHSLHGAFAFATTLSPGQTCTHPSIALELPVDRSWVPFYVAGSFPMASSADKDAVIEAHLDQIDGPPAGSKAGMIRVRKNIDKLSVSERTAYLRALHDLQVVHKKYEMFPQMHDLAAKGKVTAVKLPDGTLNPKYWPDQAHAGSAFLAWHRAFLLLFERELQSINPAVTIPYWRQNEATTSMDVRFHGSNRRPDGSFQTEVIFSSANWLYGWNISYQNLRTVVRSPKDTSLLLRPNGEHLKGDTEYFPQDIPLHGTFGKFHGQLEGDPHNRGHGALGAWHANCLISPSDPSFWSFHAEDDRLWARWQFLSDAFDKTAGDGKSYDKSGKFVPNNANSDKLGHNLEDTMWPWDGTKGKVVEDDNGKGNRPGENPFPPFPKSLHAGLWPGTNAMPTPGDMIDHHGIHKGNLPHGVCYDDIPFGARPPSPPAPPNPAAEILEHVAADENAALELRSKSLKALKLTSVSRGVRAAEVLVGNANTPASLLGEALDMLPKTSDAFDILVDKASRGDGRAKAMREMLVAQAPVAHLTSLSTGTRQQVHKILSEIAGDSADASLAARASMALAAGGEATAIARLKELIKVTVPPVPRAEIAAAIADNAPDAPVTARELLQTALDHYDPDTVLVLLRVLAGDADSRAMRLALVDNEFNGDLIQRGALRSVMRESPEVIEKTLVNLEGIAVASINDLNLEATGAFRVAIEHQKPFTEQQLLSWKARVEAVKTKLEAAATANAADLRQALSMALEVLENAKPH